MFACTLFVRMWTNSPCLFVRYLSGCGRIAHVCEYAFRADVDEQPVFACIYSSIGGRIIRVSVYSIRADANE